MNHAAIARALVAWHADHARDLPWRDRPAGQRDAYRVWVSEIMAQQTRLETVVGYFARWMEAFPSIEALAAADQQEVLKLWEGMGYYARARNLHRAAQIVVAQHGGVIPSERKALLALPGIGEYTVGAILSMAFGQAEPLLDGNVKRVLSRVADIAEPIDERATLKQMWSLASELVEAAQQMEGGGEAGAFNEALMELGNRLCTPTNPRCLICPINQYCLAAACGTQHERPVLPPKKSTPHYDVVAGVIWRDEPFESPLLVAQRPADKMLGGLWEFPGGKVEPGDGSWADALRREIAEELGIEVEVLHPLQIDGAPLAIAHAYTHFRITLYPLHARWLGGEPQAIGCAAWRWLALDQLDELPFPKTDWQIIHALRAAGKTAKN